jgi:hypothetical protein
MKVEYVTTVEEINLAVSTEATERWNEITAADAAGATDIGEHLRQEMSDWMGDLGNIRVIWGREQVLVLTPVSASAARTRPAHLNGDTHRL